MGLFAELQSAATEAQRNLAELQGCADGDVNFVGPDGRGYVMVFRAADAFESQQLLHGYQDRAAVVATATRSQFAAAPVDWKRKRGTRLLPAPAKDALIASVDDNDPLHYVFGMIVKQ